MLTSSAARRSANVADGDRRRDPRPGPDQARRPPARSRSSGSSSWCSTPAARRRSASACRPRSARSRRSPGSSAGSSAPAAPAPVHIVDAGVRKPLDVDGRRPGRGHGRTSATARRAEPVAGPSCAAAGCAAGRRPGQHLAEHLPTVLELMLAAPQHDHLRATPAGWPSGSPPGSTSCPRTRRRGPRTPDRRRAVRRGRSSGSWSRPTTARSPASSASSIEDELKRGELRAIVATSSLELGIDMGAVDLVIQVESPRRGQPRPAAHRSRRPPGRRAEPGRRSSRSTAATCWRRAVVARRMLDGEIEHTTLPAQPARRAGPADRGPCRRRDEWRLDDVAALVRRSANVRRAHRRRRSPTSLDLLAGRYPSEEFAELRPASCGTASPARSGRRDGSQRLAVTERRHDPRPGPVRRVPARRHAGRRARRGDGLREPGRRDVPARRVDVADRGHHVRPGHRHAGAGRAGEDAVLARRPARAGRSSCGRAVGGVRARAAASCRRRGARRLQQRLRARPAGGGATCCSTSTSRPRPPASCPTTARSSSSGSATRSATGGSCVLSPFGTPVHAPWAMAIERRAGRALRDGRSSRCGATTASCCACPRPPTSCRWRSC